MPISAVVEFLEETMSSTVSGVSDRQAGTQAVQELVRLLNERIATLRIMLLSKS